MFEKAIKIILSEPPDPHYPAYYADPLRQADVPDKDDGERSEDSEWLGAQPETHG